nr:fructosamine kinase family protein [Mesobacterium pallidum]
MLGRRITGQRPLHGGDLSEVTLCTLDDGSQMVVKTGPLVDREGRMLEAMAVRGAPVPQVLGQSGTLLLIEALPETRPARDGWAKVSTALKHLHALEGTGYGWPEDYAFGSVESPNGATIDWPGFWAERRLLPSLPHLPASLRPRIEALARALPNLLPRRPAPALLHGDLWSGNLLFTDAGPYLIDPACYHGDAEVDLGMLHLFGSPSADFHAAYGPLPAGWQARRPVYQLWPALVHLRLFGAGYQALVERLLTTTGH